jgi:hypothetical protein
VELPVDKLVYRPLSDLVEAEKTGFDIKIKMAPSQTVASPRPSRGFSFGSTSDKSRRSSNAASNKISLRESSEEKHRRSLHTKADPTLAMSEAQPMAVALEQSTLGSLRAMQHKDRFGQIIST